MASILPQKPIFMSNSTLTVSGNDYAAALQSVTITPAQSIVKLKGLKRGVVLTRYSEPEWTLETTAMQDDADTSFYTFLRTHQGEELTFILTPDDGGRPRTVKVIVPAVSVGGAIDTFAQFTVSFPVIGDVTTGALPTA